MGFLARKAGTSDLPRGIQFLRTERKPNATYHVYRGDSRSSALEFLRNKPVKEELVYDIVETPEGNVGRDLICIFDEATGAVIEYASRQVSPRPTASSTHCAWCGYFIVPVKLAVPIPKIGIEQVISYFTYEEFRDFISKGHGFQCLDCRLLQCAACTPTPEKNSGKLICRADRQSRLSTVSAFLA